MAKRIHRIGQCRAVTYTVAVAEGTIDESIWAMITGKKGVLDAVLDGADPDPAGEAVGGQAEAVTAAAAAVVWELMDRSREWHRDVQGARLPRHLRCSTQTPDDRPVAALTSGKHAQDHEVRSQY